MTSVLAIDPGPEESAYCVLLDGAPVEFAKRSNQSICHDLAAGNFDMGRLVIEQIASFGMPVGAEVFETCYWSGRFAQAFGDKVTSRIKRHEVKMHLCGNMRAKDANIRQALIDRFGGKKETKKGGKLYGISGDVWSALAVAVTFADRQPEAHE
jgi:hypothetical protein